MNEILGCFICKDTSSKALRVLCG